MMTLVYSERKTIDNDFGVAYDANTGKLLQYKHIGGRRDYKAVQQAKVINFFLSYT